MNPVSRSVILALAVVHGVATVVTSFAGLGLTPPFFTALLLVVAMIITDRSVFVLFPSFLLTTLLFLSPLVFTEFRIASLSFRGDDVYDLGLMRALYFFILCSSAYQIWGLPGLSQARLEDVPMVRTDAAPVIAGLILVVFSLLMLSNGTILTASYSEVSEEGSRLSIIEFSSLFALIGFVCARSRTARKFLIGCVVIYLLSCLLTGLRLRFLSVLLVMVCCIWGLYPNQKFKLLGFGLAIFLFFLGFVRATGVSEAGMSIVTLFEIMAARGSIDSTFGGAFQTTKFYAFYIDTLSSMHGLTGIYFFLGDLLSIFLTRSFTPEEMEIKNAVKVYFNVPGGGLLPGYFFAYFGLMGAVVLSAALMAVFVLLMRASSPAMLPYKIILIAYVPRMLLYDWVVSFKMMFIFAVLVGFLRLLALGTRSSTAKPVASRLT